MNTLNKNKRLEGEEEEMESTDRHLSYSVQTLTSSRYVIPIDEPIKKEYYYRPVAHLIANAGEHDTIEFEISSPGGYLNGLISLLSSMQKTRATTVAWINGECHSAASMLALSCDTVYVAPYATMLVHFIRFGSSGKATDVVEHVSHVYETSKKIFLDCYKDFLTEEEIKECLQGKEMYMDSAEISKRLKRKFDAMNNPAPKKVAKKKAKVVTEEST